MNINGAPFTRTWWNAGGDTVTEFTPAAKAQLGTWLLSLAVLMGAVSQGQMALLQGMRRIGDLARNSILGALLGTLLSVPIVYFYGEQGVVPELVCVAFMGIVTSWWFARKVRVEPVQMTTQDVAREAAGMLKLGFIFMTSALLTTGVTYCVQLILRFKIGNESGVEAGKAALGCYQAAWFVGGYFASFILQAMGTDFYPRLTVAASDNDECNRLVNEQAEVRQGEHSLHTHHLSNMRIKALLKAEREGTNIYYSLKAKEVSQIVEIIEHCPCNM